MGGFFELDEPEEDPGGSPPQQQLPQDHGASPPPRRLPQDHGASPPPRRLPQDPEVSSTPRGIPQQGERSSAPVNVGSDERLLYEALCGDWDVAKYLILGKPDILTKKLTLTGKTALHVAALFGHVDIVEMLVDLVPPQSLETKDALGNTPLSYATFTGVTRVAECIVKRNSSTVGIQNIKSELPVTLAFLHGHQHIGRYLYSVTPFHYLEPSTHISMLLRRCLQAHCLDIVLDLLGRRPELLFLSSHDIITNSAIPHNLFFEADFKEWRLIYGIATMNSTIPSQTELVFWKRWIYNYISIPSATDINYVPINIQPENRGEEAQAQLTKPAAHGLLQRLISWVHKFIGMKNIQELKMLHVQAKDILSLVCKHAKESNKLEAFADALFLAAKEGNVEFVVQVSKANPEILFFGNKSFKNIFCDAVQHRQAGVFNLIHGLRFKDVVVTSKDIEGDTLLHVAATIAPAPFLNRIYGPTLQMQRELQWFKEVENIIPPTVRGARNKKALIVTIVFAAAFTVPGGNDQTHGYPLFITQPFFRVFIFSTILSLLSSSTSVLMFLAILTSRYSQEKFLKSLPTKLIIGLSFLFISIVTMIVAFLSTVRLMLKHTDYSWGLLPFIIFASVPIVLFVLSQFPLLLHTAVSTYGSIFNRKVELWP